MVANPSASRNDQVAEPFANGEKVVNLVRALGGPNQVGKALGVSAQQVCMWYRRGIAPRHHAALWRLAQSKGVPWTPPGFEGVRLLVDPLHADDRSGNITTADRENTVKAADAA